MRGHSSIAAPCAFVALAVACGPRAPKPGAPAATDEASAAVAIAVYPTTAMVRERRTVELERGRSEVRFDRMPTGLDAGSVRFVSLTDPEGTRAVEQVARARPVRRRALPPWAELTDDPQRPLRVRPRRRVEHHVPVVGGVSWIVDSATGGVQQVAVRYQTVGLAWRADYAVVLAENDGDTADVNAWITIDNRSGRTYEAAAVTLVSRDQDAPPAAAGGPLPSNLLDGRGAATSYPPQPQYAPPAPAVPRYRSYEYRRRVTLRDRSQRQLEWFEAPLRDLASRKLVVYDPVGAALDHDEVEPVRARDYGATASDRVTVGVELPAVERELPPGRVRVFERAATGALTLLGETAFEGVDAGEPLRVQLGAVPGLTGRRRQTDFRVDTATRRLVEELEIELTNTGEKAREVVVREHLYRGSRFVVTSSSAPREPDGARAIRFTVEVPASGTAKVRYRVVYSWDAAAKPAAGGEAVSAPATGEQP